MSLSNPPPPITIISFLTNDIFNKSDNESLVVSSLKEK